MTGGRDLLGEAVLTPPGDDTVSHVLQHLESKNDRIYKEGFEKLTDWIINLPEWFAGHAKHGGNSLVGILAEFLKDMETNSGERAGVACGAMAALAQTIVGREGLRAFAGDIISSLLAIVKPESSIIPMAKLNAVLCLQNLCADVLLKEQLRKAGLVPVLIGMLEVVKDEEFEIARRALGALMSMCNSRPGLDDIKRHGGKKVLDRLDLAVQAVDPQTAYLKSISARIHFVQTNIVLNEKDPAKLELVDPALVAKHIGAVTGRVKTHDKKTRKKKADAPVLRGKQVAEGVKQELEKMKAAAGQEVRRSNLANSGWNTAYKKFFNANV
eukprot:jgi/Tetstr1/462347/TSEL_007353.t1